MSSVRNLYFDFLRGIAIIMVVGIHTLPSSVGDFNTIESICTITLRQIMNCAVPLFLAISGYFLSQKKISSWSGYIAFLRNQIPKIYIPTLVFSIPWLVLSMISSQMDIFHSLLNFFLCGFSIYYFVALIIQYYTLIPILSKFNNWGGVVVTAVISIVSIMLVSYLLKVNGMKLPILLYAGPFPVWILFFFEGMYLSKYRKDYSLFWPIAITVIGLGLSILEHIFWVSQGSRGLGIKLSSFIFSAGVIWLLFSSKLQSRYTSNAVVFRIMNYIGGISFGIYLLHIYIISVMHKLIPYEGWILNWVSVLCLTCLIIWAVKRIMPEISMKFLGFR